MPLANLSFELASYAIAIVVMVKVARESRFQLFLFVAAVLATILAELIGMNASHAYYYSDFLIKIGGHEMPLCIATDWAVIMFCIWRLGMRLDVPWFLVPFVCALLALPLDLALDPLAAASKLVLSPMQACEEGIWPPGTAKGLGYWVWCESPADAQMWLGVPMSNFIGWYMLVVAFMFCALTAHRYLAGRQTTIRTDLLAAFAVVVGTSLIEFGTLFLFQQIERAGISSVAVFSILMAGGFAAMLASGNRRHTRTFDGWALVALAGDFVFCVIVLFVALRGEAGAEFTFAIFAALALGLALSLWVMRGAPVRAAAT